MVMNSVTTHKYNYLYIVNKVGYVTNLFSGSYNQVKVQDSYMLDLRTGIVNINNQYKYNQSRTTGLTGPCGSQVRKFILDKSGQGYNGGG